MRRERPAAVVQDRHSRSRECRGEGRRGSERAARLVRRWKRKARCRHPFLESAKLGLAVVPFAGSHAGGTLAVCRHSLDGQALRTTPLRSRQRGMTHRMHFCGSVPCGAQLAHLTASQCAPSERRRWAARLRHRQCCRSRMRTKPCRGARYRLRLDEPATPWKISHMLAPGYPSLYHCPCPRRDAGSRSPPTTCAAMPY